MIQFTAPFGDETKTVKISETIPGSGSYQVYVDNFYQGSLRKINGEWNGFLNARSELSYEDIQAAGERVDGARMAATK